MKMLENWLVCPISTIQSVVILGVLGHTIDGKTQLVWKWYGQLTSCSCLAAIKFPLKTPTRPDVEEMKKMSFKYYLLKTVSVFWEIPRNDVWSSSCFERTNAKTYTNILKNVCCGRRQISSIASTTIPLILVCVLGAFRRLIIRHEVPLRYESANNTSNSIFQLFGHPTQRHWCTVDKHGHLRCTIVVH